MPKQNHRFLRDARGRFIAPRWEAVHLDLLDLDGIEVWACVAVCPITGESVVESYHDQHGAERAALRRRGRRPLTVGERWHRHQRPPWRKRRLSWVVECQGMAEWGCVRGLTAASARRRARAALQFGLPVVVRQECPQARTFQSSMNDRNIFKWLAYGYSPSEAARLAHFVAR